MSCVIPGHFRTLWTWDQGGRVWVGCPGMSCVIPGHFRTLWTWDQGGRVWVGCSGMSCVIPGHFRTLWTWDQGGRVCPGMYWDTLGHYCIYLGLPMTSLGHLKHGTTFGYERTVHGSPGHHCMMTEHQRTHTCTCIRQALPICVY